MEKNWGDTPSATLRFSINFQTAMVTFYLIITYIFLIFKKGKRENKLFVRY